MRLVERIARVSELDLKDYLLAEEARGDGDLQQGLNAKVNEFKSAKGEFVSRKSALKNSSREKGRLKIELEAAWAAISGEKKVNHGFT